MFFGGLKFTFQSQNLKRKETLSSVKKGNCEESDRRRASFFAPLKASLTVEAAVVLPLFFLCMIAVLQFGTVMETAARFGSALSETGERMAINAYAIEHDSANPAVVGSMSALYARGKVMGKAGNTKAVRNVSFLLSSFGGEDGMIDLVMTYQVRPLVGIVKIPSVCFVQRGSVRAWTGRSGSGGETGQDPAQEEARTVFVTENGRVYHTDENCTHIRLSIRRVSRASLEEARNAYGGRYHACEHCGGGAGGEVYITSDGNRYHSSLHCGGLRRTVREISVEEAGHLRPCSRCGGKAVK